MTGAYWPIGISTGCCRDVPLRDVWRVMAGAGVQRVEVGTPPEHFNPDDRIEPWRLGTDLGHQPFVAISVHAPFGPALDLASGQPHRRDAGVEAALAAARVLVGHPGAIVVAHPSDLARAEHDSRDRLRSALESLLLIDAFCRDAGLRLAVETPLPHLIGGHPAEMGWLLERLPPSVGLCLDTGHAHLGRHVRAFIELAGPRLIHVHLHDNDGTADQHRIPGHGAIDWCDLFDALRGVRYTGALILELACARPSAAYFAEALEAAHAICRAQAPAMLPAHLSGAE